MTQKKQFIIVWPYAHEYRFGNILYVGDKKPLEEMVPPEVDGVCVKEVMLEDYADMLEHLRHLPERHIYMVLTDTTYRRNEKGEFERVPLSSTYKLLPLEKRVIRNLMSLLSSLDPNAIPLEEKVEEKEDV